MYMYVYACILSIPLVHDGGESLERVRYRGLFDAFRSIIRQEGFTALYRVSAWNPVYMYVHVLVYSMNCVRVCVCVCV